MYGVDIRHNERNGALKMSKLSLRLSLLKAFDIKDDPVISSFIRLAAEDKETAFSAYATIYGTLFNSNKTLSDYLHDLLIKSDAPLIDAYIRDGSQYQLSAINFDVGIIRELAAVDSKAVKSVLKSKFQDEYASSLPDYDTGAFGYTADYFVRSAKQLGSGMFAFNKAFVFDENGLSPVEKPVSVSLDELKKYDYQRSLVIDNTVCLSGGHKAANLLLYGDSGTGKTCTVRAVCGGYENLRIVQLEKSGMKNIEELYRIIAPLTQKFVIFLDDIYIGTEEERTELKRVLEGGITGKPDNAAVYATATRRLARVDIPDEYEQFLFDHFGQIVAFDAPNKELYIEIVTRLAEDRYIDAEKIVIIAGAEKFAAARNGFSPRTARQYIDMVESRVAMGLRLM